MHLLLSQTLTTRYTLTTQSNLLNLERKYFLGPKPYNFKNISVKKNDRNTSSDISEIKRKNIHTIQSLYMTYAHMLNIPEFTEILLQTFSQINTWFILNCTLTHSHILPPTSIHSHSLPLTPIHCHTLPLTPTHFYSLPSTPTHSHPLPSTPSHLHSFLNHFHLFSAHSLPLLLMSSPLLLKPTPAHVLPLSLTSSPYPNTFIQSNPSPTIPTHI